MCRVGEDKHTGSVLLNRAAPSVTELSHVTFSLRRRERDGEEGGAEQGKRGGSVDRGQDGGTENKKTDVTSIRSLSCRDQRSGVARLTFSSN